MTSGGGLGGQEVGGGDENQPAVSIQLTTNNPHEGNKTPLAADPGLVAIQVSKIPAVPVVAQPQQIESSLSVQVTKTPAGVGGGHEPVSLHVTKTPIQQQHEAAVSIHLPVGGAHEPVSIHVTNNPMSGHESGSTSGDSHQSGQTERLKVEDALNYLDQVKYKFGNQPQVYNDFLDIMKEFKSQSIDTPGVISRVSNLFRGHPELIVGFNTFLPPGYKIEVQTHDQGSQISYRVDGVGYVVANMISNPLPTTTQQTSTSQIIQHAVTSAGVSIRPISSHSSHATTPATTYERNSALPGWAGIGNNGSISPPLPAVTLTPTNANFPATCSSTVTPSNANFDNTEPSSAFTHSFTSPFVQNAFPSLQSQPVQFNHAINYVNKIKNRFCGQPDKYKQFLDILHTYQKEQRNVKEGIPGKQLSEHEVYSQVSKIFENQEDLLQEFGQFLPESNHVIDMKPVLEQPKKPVKAVPPPREYIAPIPQLAQTRPPHGQTGQKRNATTPAHPISTKKPKLAAPYKDISIAEAARYGTLQEYAFFDKMRSILKHQAVFDNFIRCLYLFNKMIFSRQELLLTVQPFFCKSPEMFAWLKEFVNRRDDQGLSHEPISQAIMKQERVPEEQGIEIGEEYFSTCKRLGASYCALPKGHVAPTASGRTQLDKEVLNDVWVSFPTWSEDSTFVTSRKTQFEEYICRCEDERFELDVVIESNAETIKTLDAVARRMARMTTEELSKFTLDDCLGGRSEVVHQRSIRRVYGDKAHEIIEGMKQNPFVVIPIVLKRLKMKEDEWRESQKDFNKIWRDQVMRFYLKSLDHQGITFKQTDMRMIRSKALINEIETIYDERHEQETPDSYQPLITGPHFTLQYTDRVVLDDACNLLLHHVRRLSGIQNDDKRKIKQLLKHFIPDLFLHTRMELSDDEHEGSNDDHEERKSPVDSLQNGSRNGNKRGSTKRGNSKSGKKDEEEEKPDATLAPVAESRRTAFKRVMQQKQQVDSGRTRKRSGSAGKETRSCGSNVKVNKKGKRKPDDVPPRVIRVPHADADETYTMFYVNNAWYVFLRLHQIMCERLGRMLDTTAKMMAEDAKTPKDAKISAAVNLKMRNLNELEIHEYYPAMLEMIKNVLDGNLESNLYEDSMRELYGINAYISYTMDKVVTNAVRQLQTLVTEEMSLKFTELFFQAQKKGATGGVCDTSEERAAAEITYQKQAEKIDPEENCYKVVFYHKAFRMSVELLEGANIEENIAETTKWSAYIDSYTSHPCTGMDIKLTSLMKPVFLNRNVAVGQQYHANKTYPPEIAKIFGLEPEDVKPDLSLLDCDKTIPKRISANKPEGSSKFMLSTQTLAPVTPEEAEELEKQLERNSKRRSELVQKEQEAAAAAPSTTVPAIEPKAPIPPKNYLVTNNPVTPEEAERLEKVLEANAKRRAEAANAVKSPYVIKENLQCKFQPNSYKMIYVVNSENYFYLKGSLKRAKESHKKVSTRMNDAFGKWHQSWLEDRVTEDQIMRCDDFLMSTKNTDTKIVSSNDISLPPYRPVNHYVVKK